MSANDAVRLPEVIVFAGPNGSGKSTITQMAKVGGEYINVDDCCLPIGICSYCKERKNRDILLGESMF